MTTREAAIAADRAVMQAQARGDLSPSMMLALVKRADHHLNEYRRELATQRKGQ